MSAEGEKAQTEFCLEYKHNGSLWCLNFFAIDYADAVAKVESVKASLVLLGPLAQRIECSPELGMLVEAREKAQQPLEWPALVH